MPRYYFELMDEGQLIEDDEGVEFVDLQTMQAQALRAAGTMVSEKTIFPTEPWAMIVRDEAGRTIATLTFTAA